MEFLWLGLSNLLQPPVMLALVIGAIGGLMIGAIPGIGPAIAIAILLPATVFLDDLVSLVLLLGVYGSSMYGGAIPAILITTPGTPVNALTTSDGYAMTQRGEAGRGLSLAYSASFFGGCFSILVALAALVLFGPYLRDLGALFGQRDIFMAAALGAVLLILAHRQTMVIAALLFGIGFLISLIGRQSLKRIDRYTFEYEYLYAGFNLIVVIVGIFAISQALYLLTGKDADPPEARMKGGLFRGLGELRRYKLVAAISASYGTVMGIIPGVGEFVAQFFSYSTARFLSRTPTQFGHGAPEGLIASETANNAVPAAAMIPLLALGVPGEALTAMMMVVFFDAGIKPGPDIFENSSDFLFSLFIALLMVNLLVVVMLMFCTKYIAKMVYIPNRFLGVDPDAFFRRRILDTEQFCRLHFCQPFRFFRFCAAAAWLAACASGAGSGAWLDHGRAPDSGRQPDHVSRRSGQPAGCRGAGKSHSGNRSCNVSRRNIQTPQASLESGPWGL